MAKPGVSVAVAKLAPDKAPTVIVSVAINDVVSTLLSLESLVVATTLLPATTDDGVSTLLIVST